ncbi:MAG TPA: hypothetical protein VGB74_17695 [Actinoplanes sp.]
MTITLHGLLQADTARVRAVAARWSELAAALDGTVEELGSGTRDLPHHWSSGPGSVAAQERVARLRIQAGNSHQECTWIASAVRVFADEVEQSRERLLEVVREAESRGVRIDLASGRITAPVTTAAGFGLAGGDVDAYVREIAEILAQADAADRRAMAVLGAHALDGLEAPSAEPPQQNPYSLLTLAGYPPRQQADWWRDQHPLLQERAITEHPEIVGALPGVPSRDRDAANRLLLARARETAIADRNRLAAAPQEIASRALPSVDDRLAGIAELERRLADPSVHLVGYQPGDERNATVTAATS